MRPSSSRVIVGLVLLAFTAGCAAHDDKPSGSGPVLVFTAFLAELDAVLAHATIEETVEISGRWFRIGTLGGVPVVINMTGIGIANAAEASRIAFDNFDVVGAVFSGVAGSYLRIGDVAVPQTWELANGMTFPCDPQWLDLAHDITAPGIADLDACTEIPSRPAQDPVCLTVPPVIVVGGRGFSSGFEETLVSCQPEGGDVFGCDCSDLEGEGQSVDASIFGHSAAPPDDPLASEDMESAAVAREAAGRGLRFIAFRAVSDGAGDPQNLPGFPAQFFEYYRLAARNAAAATTAFLERLAQD